MIFHPLIHTYEKAGCQVNKRYQLPTRGPQIGLIAKHLSVITQRCHTIMHLINGVPITSSASPFVGHRFGSSCGGGSVRAATGDKAEGLEPLVVCW